MRYNGWAVLGALLVAWVGCTDGTGPDDTEVARIDITPAADTLFAIQDTLPLASVARNAQGEQISGARISWTALDPAVATVDTLGRVVSRDVGTARIVAQSGSASDTARISVISGVQTAQLNFVELAPDAPSPVVLDTSFWAVRGQSRELRIRLNPDGTTGAEGEEILRFQVDDDALLRYPDGRSFATNDSVQIRVRLDETGRFLFAFEPSGLRFDPDKPAELRIRYRHADQDDLSREDAFALWRQEQPGAVWVRIRSARVEEDEIRAEITGFTAFSLATN